MNADGLRQSSSGAISCSSTNTLNSASRPMTGNMSSLRYGKRRGSATAMESRLPGARTGPRAQGPWHRAPKVVLQERTMARYLQRISLLGKERWIGWEIDGVGTEVPGLLLADDLSEEEVRARGVKEFHAMPF